MNPERQVQRALRALAEHDRLRESPQAAPAIFHLRPVSRWKIRGVYAAVALASAAMLALYFRPAPRGVEPVQPAIVSEAVPDVQEVVVQPEPASQPVRRARRLPAEVAEAPREVLTEFFPLMDAPPPFERGQLLRVTVPAATMRSVGLPIHPDRWSDRVQADVLVGEEGMARAIRFVSYEQ